MPDAATYPVRLDASAFVLAPLRHRPEVRMFEIRTGTRSFEVGRKDGEPTYRIDGQLVTVREYLTEIAKATTATT